MSAALKSISAAVNFLNHFFAREWCNLYTKLHLVKFPVLFTQELFTSATE